MPDTIVSAEQLERGLAAPGAATWRVLDCRASLADLEHGRRVFAQGHIPGAQHADLDDDLAKPAGEGGRHPLPDPVALVAKLCAWGISDADQLVAYDDAGGAFAGRAWWLLRWLGHEQVAVLDGGLAAWRGELSQDTSLPSPGRFTRRTSLVRVVEADAIVSELGALALVDARAQPRFDGREEPIDPVAGHIPGAVCLPFQGNLDDAGHFLSAAELRERFDSLGDDPVCYCGSGVTAAHNVLAMRIAGLPEPRLYPGSWSEWILDPSRPMVP
ncbi:MAG: sulfurtransferase [Deltaproteobacteria bacterium]|nr:sulfurtransferase [Deltaproteobacteria bacterium]MBW2362462.1 sulfurtransferase [Deltaproteobacteria bacterium]